VSLTNSLPDPDTGIAFTAAGASCFYCGKPTSDPSICWSGFSGDIYLHPACWPRLATRLFRDLHEVEKPDYYQRRREGTEAT
jgi:hypothetical protein